MGAMNIGQASPYVEAFSVARAAAAAIFTVIDRIPEIDSFSDEGMIPKDRNNTTTDSPKNNNTISGHERQFNNNNGQIKVNGNMDKTNTKSGEWTNSGNIIFDNVKFNYPSRPDIQVF